MCVRVFVVIVCVWRMRLLCERRESTRASALTPIGLGTLCFSCVSFFCGCFVKKTHNKTKQFLLVKRDWHPDTVRLILPWFGIIVDYSGPIYGEEFSFPSLVWWVTVFFSPFVCCWLSCQSMPDKSNKMFSCNHATGDLDFFPFMSVLRAGPLVNEKYFRDSALAQVLETKIYNNMNR